MVGLPPSLAGKIAPVTGASRGIGRAIAQCLASSGALVVITARSLEWSSAGAGQALGESLPGTSHKTVNLIASAGAWQS